MTIEIVDFPINSMVIFNGYVSHYQRVLLQSECLTLLASLWQTRRAF